MTVSNVLNGRASVRPANRERVLAAVRELGYTPNVTARQLRRGRAAVVGIIVPEAINPFYSDIVRGIDEGALDAGMAALTMTSHDSLSREESLLDLMLGMRVSGVVLSSVSNWNQVLPRVHALTDQGIPMVALATEAEVADACSSISGDDRAGGQLVGRHLADLGHRRILFAGGSPGVAVFDARFSGMVRGLADAGVSTEGVDYLECAEPSLEAGYAGALGALEPATRPTAIFCANDLLALGVLRAAATLGLRVPEDIAIAGYDDISFAAGATVPLTSVAQPTREMGRRAAEMLLTRDSPTRTHEVFAPNLQVRASTLAAASHSRG